MNGAMRMVIALLWMLGSSAVAQAQGPQYAGAGTCTSCHKAIHDVWVNTKHAKALTKLSDAERKAICIGCHVTGTPEQIAAEGDKPKFPGVQCEACHGPGSLHVADPKVMTGLAKTPTESACTKCHNEKSPHFHGFVYAAMAPFSHPVKK
jgi:Cytochrome c554 and c-prime